MNKSNREIITKWFKDDDVAGNYIDFYEDDLSSVTMDGSFDFDKLIKMLDDRF